MSAIESLANGTLHSYAAPIPNRSGDVTHSAPPIEIGVRCVIDDPTFTQRAWLGGLAASVTATVYMEKSSMPAGFVPVKRSKLVMSIDDSGGGSSIRSQSYLVETFRDRSAGVEMSHWELFVRPL